MRLGAQRPFYGWAVLIVAALIGFSSGPGQSFMFSVFIDPMIEDTGLSRTLISTLYAIGTGVSAAMVMVVSRLADRFGVRITVISVAILLGLVCFGMSVATAGIAFVVLFAALRALGQGSMPINANLLAAQWFVRRRGVAVSIIGLGLAASNAILPPVTRQIIELASWREAYVVLGIMVWVLVIPGTLLIVRNRPEDRGLYPDGASEPPAGEVEHDPSQPQAPDKRRILTSITFWRLAAPLATPSFIVTGLVFHQASIFEEQGLNATQAANVFVPFAIASAACALGAGVLIDRFGPRPVFIANMAVLFIATALALVLGSAAMAVLYAVLLGATGGTAQVIQGTTWAHFYGRWGLGRVQGSAMMVGITGAALAPLPLALFQGATGSFATGITAMLVLPVISAVSMYTVRRGPAVA